MVRKFNMKKYAKQLIILFCITLFIASICFIPIRVSKLIPIIEEKVSADLGVNIHMERLILRIGPMLKLKTPIMHIMYSDGQKFAQLDNVKFYIPWSSIFRDTPRIAKINAKKLTVRVLSDDKELEKLITNINKKKFNEKPNLKLKEYKFSYLNKVNNDSYTLSGSLLDLRKNYRYKTLNLKTKGVFAINSKNHINYDLIINPNINLNEFNNVENLLDIIEQFKELDFYSDIIADIKLYKAENNITQASGFINIDNISILEKNKKVPKSFIYLTLWGDKASILSNLYTSPDKKIYIEGMINNSKKPTLDIKVKADDIIIADLFDVVKIFTKFSHFKDIKSVTGVLSANFNLKGSINKLKSNGFLKINDASLKADDIKIDKINSEIDFSNNTVNITNTTGYINNAPIIVKGKINQNIDLQLLMNKIELSKLIPSKYGVKDGIISLIADFSGTLDDIRHKENILIENFKISNKNYGLSFNTLKYDTNKNNTAIINNILLDNAKTAQIKIPTLKIDVGQDIIKIPETSAFMLNSKLALKADLLNYNNINAFNYIAILSGCINSKDLVDFETKQAEFPFKTILNGNSNTQNINTQVVLNNSEFLEEPALVNLSAKFDKNIIRIDDFSLNSFNGNFDEDIKNNLKGLKKLIITGNLENLKEPIFKNLRLFIPQQIKLKIADTQILAKGDLFFNGKVNNPEIIGQISFQNLVNEVFELSIPSLTLDFNKNNIILNAPLLKLLDSTFALNALISTDISNELIIKNINIKSKFLNTDTLLLYKDSPILKTLPIVILDGKFYAEKLTATVYDSQLYLTALVSELKLKDNIVKLQNLTAELLNGKLNGSIDYNLRDENFNTKLMVRGVSAEPIFKIISARKENISGIMDFDANLSGELTSKNSILGDIKFVINNGRMTSLGKLEHLLYAQNVIADNMLRTSLSVITKAITLKDTGLFKYLRGDVSIKNGLANIHMLQSQGPHMALFIKGDYNILNDNAQLLVLGRLSDEIISGLGAFADFSFNKLMIMLTGEEQSQNIYTEYYDKIPQLPVKNTKEFRSIINGNIDKASSVIMFNWISYSEKSLKQKEAPISDIKIPDFIEKLPY